ncbi:unnamed protein product [Clavelina lepadiformis]|uniref:Uncharacterized protein n=1 Tax=Clavelina lepadiformis TaxID=159417 RepID=A0ABP0GI31_CLALP
MNKVALKNLAEHPDVIRNPVAVISIAGAMREGKSFLLNLLVMYLESNLDCHWLDKPDTPIPYNFNWKGGIRRETRGVWIWSKPYLVQKKNGTKIALLLMDTQGCFDRSGARNDSNIFTFSTLLSSVQIYNLKEQIKENHLQPLAVFIDYAKESMKKAQSLQCFQTLLFLIRDWMVEDDFPFGKEGGDKYLEQEAFHYEGNDPDITMVRDQIRNAFTSTNCVLLPHPGMVIAGLTPKKPGTPICVKEMDDKFKDEIHHFLRILIDDFTIPLKVGQKDIVGEELLNFTSKLFDLLQTNDIENPASAMEEIAIKSKCEGSGLTRKHEEAQQKALQDYNKDSAALHNNHKEPYKELLEKKIKYCFQKHLGTWKANQTILHLQYNEKLLEIIGNYERLLKEDNPSAKEKVDEDFHKLFFGKPHYSQYEEKLKSRMKIIENKMEKAKEIHKRKEEKRGTKIIEQLQQHYNIWMDDLGHCTEEGLKTSHEKFQSNIFRNYEQLFETRYGHLYHEFRIRLVEMLEQSFRNYQHKRLEKENTLRKEYEELVNKTLKNFEKVLEDGKENAKEIALISFYENKPADETYYKEYYEKLVANMNRFQHHFENQQRLKKVSDELKGKEIVERLLKRYNAEMDQVGICKDEEFKRKENDIQTKILQDSEFITSFADLQKEIKEMLVGNLQENSISKKQALDVEKNKLRDKYEKLLEDVLTNYKGYLQKRHPNANELAMTDYKKRSPDDKYFYEEYSDKLDYKMKEVFNEYQKNEELVELSSRNLVFSICAAYEKSMKDAVEKDYSTESDFQQIHCKYEKQALTQFDERLKCPEYFDDIKSSSRNELKEKIVEIFVDCSNNRQRKENTLRKVYEKLVDKTLNDYEKVLEDGKKNAKESALTSFYENKPDNDTYYKEYYEKLVINIKKCQHHFENQQQLKKELENCKKELGNLESELRKSKEQNKKQLVDLTCNKDVIRQLTEEKRQLEQLENKKNSYATHIPLEQIWAIPGEEGSLGEGNFGCVRLGFTKANGAVAIKIFKVSGSREQIKETHNKVMKEIRNLKLSNHANVIRLEGYTTWRGAAGIIMEYMPAGDLHFFLTACNNHTPGFKIPDIPADIRLRICTDVASGVAFLHHGFTDQRITHGDLKPHNILLTYDLRCKVGDFGGTQFATCTDEVHGIPAGGRQEFTYCYASPERLLNRTIRTSKAMDVYSVSMIYYEVLARKAPFRGSGLSPGDIVEHVARQRMRPSLNDVESLKEQSSTDDKEIISLIEDEMKKCWSHSPEERPSTIDVRDVFERVLAAKDIPSIMRHVANITQHMDISIPSRRQGQCVRIDQIPSGSTTSR